MSFSTEQKADIFSQPIKSVCCKRALLAGIVTSKGSVKDGLITAAVDSKATAQEVAEVIRAAYSKGADITTMPKGGRGYLVSFSAPSCVNVLNDFLGGGEPFVEKCPQCQCNFFRGLFIACGRVTDPTKQYLLEFTPKNELDRFVSLFDELGLDFPFDVEGE